MTSFSGRPAEPPLRIGVLALQGDFAAHEETLGSLGARVFEVRAPGELEGLDGLVIPGGESTTISQGIAESGLDVAIRSFAADGGPVFGTCAGLIVCDREHLGLIDARARRNAFGRQRHSFETDLEIKGVGPDPVRAVFIRAPWVEEAGPEVETLASFDERAVVIREGVVLACAFHPELTDDSRLHALFMAMATAARGAEQPA